MLVIKYKCRCMAVEKDLEVANRPAGADIVLWMGVVRNTIALDHATISPNCGSDVMEFVKIPIDEAADNIGEKPRIN